MALQSQGTHHDQLSQFPVELLVAIFQQCTDFSSLWSLMHTCKLMLSVFDDWACDIVSAVMAGTVPVQTRVLMQAILAMHTGTFQCTSFRKAFYFVRGHIPPADRVTASPTQLRNFVYLSHHIHVLAHLCIDRCIQRCLESPLGQRQYPSDFEIPSWTEEQRTVLGFWRVMFWNQLKIQGSKGSLPWYPHDLRLLADYNFPGYNRLNLEWTALFSMVDDSPAGSPPVQLSMPRHPFKLPSIPSEQEFHWVCEPPPSSRAITQGRSFEQHGLSLEAMFSSYPATHQETQQRADGESSQEANQEHRHEPSLRPTLQLSTRSPSHQETQQSADEESSQETTQEHRHEPNVEPTVELEEAPRARGRRYYFGPDSDEESENDYELNSDDFEEVSEDEQSSSGPELSPDSRARSWNLMGRCTLHNVPPYVPRPVRDYGPHSPQEKEWENLDQGSLGTQFWLNMSGNPASGPAKYMRAGAYVPYGFAIWEEQRMIQFGLWSHHTLDNDSEYYRRWYTFLSPQDIDRWKDVFRDDYNYRSE